MTLYRQPGSSKWSISFTYKGQRYRGSSETADKKHAKEIEAKWRRDLVDQERLGKLIPLTVADACMRYLNERVIPKQKTNLKVTSASAASRLKRIGAYFGEETQLVTITAPKIAAWKHHMLEDGLMAGTIDRTLQLFRAVLNLAKKEWGALREVPHVGLLNVKNDRLMYLDPFSNDEDRLLAAADWDQDFRDFLLCLLDTGARKGDATQLEWTDINWAANTIWLHHTKTDEPRHVPMTIRCREMLERRYKARKTMKVFPYDPNSGQKEGAEKGQYAPRRRKDGTVPGVYARDDENWCAYVKVGSKKIHLGSFPTEQEAIDARIGAEAAHGNLTSGASLRTAWMRAMLTMGLSDFTIHDTRHCFATKLVTRGADLFHVQKLLGHRDPMMTQRYAHLVPSLLQPAVDRLNRPVEAPAIIERRDPPER